MHEQSTQAVIGKLPPQFVAWELRGNDKIPIDYRTGRAIDHTDPTNWQPYDVIAASGRNVGWSVMAPYFFLDLDGCYTSDGWSPQALAIVNALPGAAVELSQSRTGLHFIGRCDPSFDWAKTYYIKFDGWKEFYTSKRLAAFGGHGWQGDPNLDWSHVLPGILKLRPPAPPLPPGAGKCPVPDEMVLERMLRARSAAGAFGDRATPADLFNGNAAVLGRLWPGIRSGEPWDRSSADMALMTHLAFWTRCDSEMMDRLFRRSALMREKYEKREDYRASTINGAISVTHKVADWEAPAVAAAPGAILTITDQIEHFAGCTYVRSLKRVLTPTGELLDAEQFRAQFGGHEFLMQADGARPTRNAFEAFTENRAHRFPKVRSVTLRPDQSFGAIIDEEVNAYVRRGVEPIAGDVTLFLEHLNYLIPNASDGALLLAWMARIVQQPGRLIRWAPALIGLPGNGKSFLLECVEKAIGATYTHKVKPQEITATHNGWIIGKLFGRVEEIKMSQRRDILEDVKTWITDPTINVRAMRTDSVSITNVLNFMFATNHRDGIVKLRDDRRFGIFQTVDHVQPDSYYVRLFNWAESGGYAAIAWHLLHNVDASRLPARAPHTSGTDNAIANTLGRAEQFVLQAIEEGRPGLHAGWASAWTVRQVLAEEGIRPAPRTLGQIMRNIGYRELMQAPRPIPHEGGKKPTIYCCTDRAPDFERYQADQGYFMTSYPRLVTPSLPSLPSLPAKI